MREQVVEFLADFERAQARQDFGIVAPFIDPNAVFRFNDGDYAGHDAIRSAFEVTWAHDIDDESYATSDVDVRHVDGNTALATFRGTWSGRGSDGAFELEGRGTTVVTRHEGVLKVLLEHLSR